jgi:hypothetical protein
MHMALKELLMYIIPAPQIQADSVLLDRGGVLMHPSISEVEAMLQLRHHLYGGTRVPR